MTPLEFGQACTPFGVAWLIVQQRAIKAHLASCPVCTKRSKVPLALASIGILVMGLLLCGCVRIGYTAPDGAQFHYTRPAFGKVVIGKLDVTRGSNTVHLEGYQSDQVEAMKAVAEGVATGLAKAAKP